MFRVAKLDHGEPDMIIGQASGNYNLHRISIALRSAYLQEVAYSASHTTHPGTAMIIVSEPPPPTSCPDEYTSKQLV